MSPGDFNLPRDSLQFSDKYPPPFDGYANYEQFKENVFLCDAIKSVAAEKRAPTLIRKITDRVTAKTLLLSTLTSNTGLDKLMVELNKTFG